ncbi:hypothetical protein LTR37_014898 [Vermiconidia calcicola]|uniref:Uncharacterized protein n=1 Tax=Vermiconidia calcicola TaxID=1690605 RepID=A0ACC3MV33_9PEZI|nr:hypothetical protein LTR37_014898 [Vermiconidia calcicola]
MSLVDTYHAYVYGTSFWYFLRGFMRVVDPVTVISWFRPPAETHIQPNDLEVYTTRIDAFGLITLAGILLVLSDAVALPESLVGSSMTVPASEKGKKPYARAIVLLTMFHHITTGIGSFTHWSRESHHTIAMDIGVYGNIALTALGLAALVFGLAEDDSKRPAVRSPRKSR